MTTLYTPTGAAYELHRALDRIILPSFSVQAVSITSLAEMNRVVTSRFPILGEYSNGTIFGDCLDNYRQRMHHDMVHLKFQSDTSPKGEYPVMWQQCLEIERVSGAQLADILWGDLYGQVVHMVKYGVFPAQQALFTMDYLRTGQIKQY